MLHRALIDNWTLQNAGELLCNGLSEDSAHDLVFTKDRAGYRYEAIEGDVVRFEALCQLLNSLVFMDELYVDANFADAWTKFEPLNQIHSSHILVKKPFKTLLHEWITAREVMAERLCINSSLLKDHRANKRAFAKDGRSKDEFLAQLLWGGAGMLARADYFNLPYVPHPARARLFNLAGIVAGPASSTKLSEFVTSERAKIFRKIGGPGVSAQIQLPPVVIQILEEANDIEGVIKTALQMRDIYKSLRGWLTKLHRAFAEENTKEILAHHKILESVARHVDSYSSLTPQGDTTLQIGISWLKVGVKGGSPLNAVKNRFGMRAELNRLILAPAGHNSLKKFAKMLGEQNTKRGRALVESLIKRLTAPT